MNTFTFHADDEAATAWLGHVLANVLPDGTVVGLVGTLGAGKTRLVQAIATAAGVARSNVVSPTFVLVGEYHGRRSIYHLDVYRLHDEDEFNALGPEEYFESDGLTLVEWGDRVEDCLPKNRLEIVIEVSGPTSRTFRITATSTELDDVVAAIRKHLVDERAEQ